MLTTREYFEKLSWSRNPFTLTISPDLMVGNSTQVETLLSHINNHHKFAMVIGPTGSGKTTILNWINMNINNNRDISSFYVPKPPASREDLIYLFKYSLGFNLIDVVRFRNLNMMNITKFLIKKTRHKKVVLLMDEAHESTLEILEWVRTINDVVPNLMLVFAGLSVFEKKIEIELPTLFMRVNTRVHLVPLNIDETRELIQKRIEKAGGKGIGPFTSDSINKIFEMTGGFPREIIKACNHLLMEAIKRDADTIDTNLVNEIFTELQTTEPTEPSVALTEKQREILQVLNTHPDLSPAQIVELTGIGEYRSKDHAVRSVNNILRRLMIDELIVRKKLTNTYVYSLSGKAKTSFAQA